jgi:hypothetical protein
MEYCLILTTEKDKQKITTWISSIIDDAKILAVFLASHHKNTTLMTQKGSVAKETIDFLASALKKQPF